MKKSYLMIAAAATLLTACMDNDTFREINETEGPAISFSTYAQKATRAENSDSTYKLNLYDHHTTFKVYGFKNTDATPVFNGDSVGYSNSAWSYATKKYWDKGATTYEFYAFAPDKAPFDFYGVDGIDSQKDGNFKITTPFNKVGDNVSPKNSPTPVASWKDLATDNIDLMIADTCRLSGASLTAAQTGSVTLQFIHVLSRLNITVQTINDLDPSVATNDSLCVDSIVITNIAHAGTFDEVKAGVNAAALRNGTHERWTATDKEQYKYVLDYTATPNPVYVIESLVIPQTVVKDTINQNGTFPNGANVNAPYIKIDYSIYSYNSKDGTKNTNKQHYTAYYNLAKIFGIKTTDETLAFNEGWQNTLKITISPAIINFDGQVAPWADKGAKELTIF